MLYVKQLPDEKVLSKFAERYPEINIESVIQFLTLLRVGSDLSSALDGFLAGFGLLQSRWWVLLLLMREESLMAPPSKLAEQAGVSRATMSGLIEGLSKEGLIRKTNAHEDRRSYHVQLTKAGQQKLDDIMPEYYRRVAEIMKVISPEEANVFLSVLKKLQMQNDIFK